MTLGLGVLPDPKLKPFRLRELLKDRRATPESRGVENSDELPSPAVSGFGVASPFARNAVRTPQFWPTPARGSSPSGHVRYTISWTRDRPRIPRPTVAGPPLRVLVHLTDGDRAVDPDRVAVSPLLAERVQRRPRPDCRCGVRIYTQSLPLDAAAVQGLAFTPGLRLTAGE